MVVHNSRDIYFFFKKNIDSFETCGKCEKSLSYHASRILLATTVGKRYNSNFNSNTFIAFAFCLRLSNGDKLNELNTNFICSDDKLILDDNKRVRAKRFLKYVISNIFVSKIEEKNLRKPIEYLPLHG